MEATEYSTGRSFELDLIKSKPSPNPNPNFNFTPILVTSSREVNVPSRRNVAERHVISQTLVSSSRWLHAYCDQFTKEEDVERAADVGYKCYYCRPKSQSYFSITTSSSMSMTARWSQSTVNTITSMSSYGFGTFGKLTTAFIKGCRPFYGRLSG